MRILFFIFILVLEMTPMSTAETLTSSVLKPCPASPNCVCSLDSDKKHAIEPLFYGDQKDLWQRLKEMIKEMPRTTLISESEDYLHYEFRTRFLRFKDDVEIWNDHENRKLHFRSASRIGYSDLGTNRRRVERMKSKILKLK